jgi:hypothetical protein
MTVSLGIFIVSGTLILLMILVKGIQMRTDTLLFWPSLRHKSEVALKQKRSELQKVTSIFEMQNVYILLHRLITALRNLFIRIVRKLDEKSHHVLSHIKGKQRIDESRKSASAFLHDITQFKDRFRK